ncbi:MAG: SDR family oxidoreductase [Deltaproteobacteria bacterium]|nr:SDR family oxidoreductase [Deltaproteobacteria bacterium]
MKIKGSTVLITGAARRVGREIALAMARAGAHVIVHYRNSQKEAKRLAAEIQSLGVKASLIKADLSQIRQVHRLLTTISKRSSPIDVLINNASVFYRTPLQNVTEKQWDEIFNTNLRAPFFLSRDIGLRMKKAGKGKIINIADWSGLRPYSGYIPYCLSKGALMTMTQALARDLAPEVQVVAVAPGPVMWPEGLGEKEKRTVIEKTPLRRLGSPKDVVETVRFLVEGSDFMTGSTIFVDGGRLIA